MANLRRRPDVIATVAVMIGIAAVGAWAGSRSGTSPAATTGTSTTTTPIVRTTLVATEPVMAHVTPTGQWTMTAVGGATPDEVRSATSVAEAAMGELADAQAAFTAARRVRDLTLAGDRATIAVAPDPAGHAAGRQRLALDTATEGLAVTHASSAVSQAAERLATSTASLEAARTRACGCGSTVTSLARLGSAIDRGGALYAIDGQPTLLLIGETPAYRAMRLGDSGPDVEELQRNLVALGRPLTATGTFDPATQAAVATWQAAASEPVTGVVRLGDVVFLPSTVLVTAQRVAVGGGVGTGQPLLDLSSSDLVVDASLDPGVATHVHARDALAIHLPDGSLTQGHVTAVGTIATAAAAGSGESGSQSGQASQGGAAFGVTIEARADDPALLTGLAGATVSIDVTLATVTDVLAVPVDALLILADGRPAVEVATGSTTRFVPVQIGVYDRTLVEVRGDGLSAGDLVVVPAA